MLQALLLSFLCRRESSRNSNKEDTNHYQIRLQQGCITQGFLQTSPVIFFMFLENLWVVSFKGRISQHGFKNKQNC